jgi:DNA polymerase IV (DinB-like DNA polymerase)
MNNDNAISDFTQVMRSTNGLSVQSGSWKYKRVVVHVDLNSFYPSCEELRSPELVGKPHAVIMTRDEGDQISKGVVASCSYEAKKLGVKSAMPLVSALKACPDLVLNRADIQYYLTISEKVMNILHGYSDTLEQTSIDEAYLDCSDKIDSLVMDKNTEVHPGYSTLPCQPVAENEPVCNVDDPHLIEDFARSIKTRIKTDCGLLTSVGVAPTKSIAKIASDFRKPDGLTIVSPTEVCNFLENLEVNRISGIGSITQRSLKLMGIKTVGQLARTDIQTLVNKFGNKHGIRMWKIANGLDDDPVRPRAEHTSLSTEYTLPDFTKDQQMLLSYFETLTDELFRRIQRRRYLFRTVGIKLVHADFVVETRERSYQRYQETRQSISNAIPGLLQKFYSTLPENQEEQIDKDMVGNRTPITSTKLLIDVPIRKIGIKISNLILKGGSGSEKGQLSMPDYF